MILMDMQMPELNGFDAAKILHDNGFKKPIIAMTSSLTKEDEMKCMDAGCDDFVSKPIGRNQLEKILRKYMTPMEAVNAA
jgi:CheY-like chemotaxis protein